MPVHIIENEPYGTKAYCTVNEGLGKVLRFGAFDASVLDRLSWIEKEFAPVMDAAVQALGGIDTKQLSRRPCRWAMSAIIETRLLPVY